MTVLLDLPGLCVKSLCHKQVTLDILRKEVKFLKKYIFPSYETKCALAVLSLEHGKQET